MVLSLISFVIWLNQNTLQLSQFHLFRLFHLQECLKWLFASPVPYMCDETCCLPKYLNQSDNHLPYHWKLHVICVLIFSEESKAYYWSLNNLYLIYLKSKFQITWWIDLSQFQRDDLGCNVLNVCRNVRPKMTLKVLVGLNMLSLTS